MWQNNQNNRNREQNEKYHSTNPIDIQAVNNKLSNVSSKSIIMKINDEETDVVETR